MKCKVHWYPRALLWSLRPARRFLSLWCGLDGQCAPTALQVCKAVTLTLLVFQRHSSKKNGARSSLHGVLWLVSMIG